MIVQALYELARLRRNQWLDPQQLERIQLGKLKALLQHAYENVAYYRSLFDSVGVRPDHVKTLQDLDRIPITTKAQLQDLATNQIVARGTAIEHCLVRRTSGSTGRPLTVYISQQEKFQQTLVSLRILMANGLCLSDKLVYLSTQRHFAPQDRWFQRLGILRRYNISVADSPEEQARRIREIDPDVLYGYPSALALLASTTDLSSLIRPRLIFTTAEMLSPETRQLLDKAFGVETRDVYGTLEFGDIGWECDQRRGYHINTDCVLAEVVKNGRQTLPGEAGELVCTGLHSFTMPLIRYRVGDVCTLSKNGCSCGRGLSLMKVIEGRSVDFISLPDGRAISPSVVINRVKQVSGIRQYRIAQKETGALLVQIVRNDIFSGETAGQVRAVLTETTGNELEVAVEVVDHLPREKSDKFRPIRSNITPRF